MCAINLPIPNSLIPIYIWRFQYDLSHPNIPSSAGNEHRIFLSHLLLKMGSPNPTGRSSGFAFEFSGPNEAGNAQDFEVAASRRALAILKTRLGEEAIYKLLQADIEATDQFWRDVVAKSVGGEMIPSTTHVLVQSNDGLTTGNFVAWFASDAGGPDKLIRGHPEHYVNRVGSDPAEPGALSATIVEAWAGKITRFRIPRYGMPDRDKSPFLQALPDYPVQLSGVPVLDDGTAFAVVHNSFRDREGGGLEALLTVWVPSVTPEDVMEGIRQHQAIEWVNWLSAAQRDIASGIFKVSD